MKTKQCMENWKLCDYTYCPQVVQGLCEAGLSIQSSHNSLMLRMQDLYDIKKVIEIMDVIDAHKEEIDQVHGFEGNSVYLLQDFGLSRSLIRDRLEGKVDLTSFVFLSMEQIIARLSLSFYHGSKIFLACRQAVHVLMADTDIRKQDILRQDLCDFFRGKSEAFTFEEIEEKMVWSSPRQFLYDLLDSLVGEGLIAYDGSLYSNRSLYPRHTLGEVLEQMQDPVAKKVVVDRLHGATMESIALSLEPPVSRSRVGQIFHNEIDAFPPLKEDCYVDLLTKYDLIEEIFYAITGQQAPVWGYLQERYHDAFECVKEKVDGEILAHQVAKESYVNTKKLYAYLEDHYLNVYGWWVDQNDKATFLQAICRSFDGYFQKEDVEKRYKETLEVLCPKKVQDWGLLHFRIDVVLKQGYLIYSSKRGWRYRIISRDLVSSIMDEIHIERYKDTVVSTKKLFEDAIDVMEKYDIRDPYELHSLLRTGKERYRLEAHAMEFGRMPMLQFGKGQENEIVAQEIRAMAPIDVDEFARYMARRYGYDIRTFITYLRRNFNSYIEENRIDLVDEDFLLSSDFLKMDLLLTKPFYFLEDYQALVEQEHLSSKLMDPYMIRRLGYKNYAGYILKEPLTPGKYFERWILENSSKIEARHLALQSFMYTLDRLEKQLEVFEWEKNRYVPLADLSINKKELLVFVERMAKALKPGQYFTQKSLVERKIVTAKRSNTFYKSLLKSQKNMQILSMGIGYVFVKDEKAPSVRAFFEQILQEQPRLTLTGFQLYLFKMYGLHIERRSLQDRLDELGFYISADTERIYIERPRSMFEQERLFE